MPRGEKYSEEIREEARRLRRLGWSLGEIAEELGPPKNTLTLWVRDIALAPEQRVRIQEKERKQLAISQAAGGEWNRQARLERIRVQEERAELTLDRINDQILVNHVAAAMLYLGEGAKADGHFCLANSNPNVIRYWTSLIRSSFPVDEEKFCLQFRLRADQDIEQVVAYWTELTGIYRYTRPSIDPRTEGKPTQREGYMGVCVVHYYDTCIRRYLDALAAGLMANAEDVERAGGRGAEGRSCEADDVA